MNREARLLSRTPLPDECSYGTFFAPHAYAINRLDQLQGEVFGPVLHVMSYAADHLDEVLDRINATGYGLTLGIHSRIDGAVRHIHKRLRVGNTYVNRNDRRCRRRPAVWWRRPLRDWPEGGRAVLSVPLRN
jgi:RHH-type transcriptional regulator, proline utilization regulon repressor / proline dehydrogenase / delta 1-pyrroline-5-carboxylate dehydrogenase